MKALARRVLPNTVLGRIRDWRVRRLVRNFTPRVVRHSYGGHDLSIRLTDPLAAGWYDHDWPVLPEVRFLRELRSRAGATVFDLGAHHGVVALMLAREVGPSGTVVAVEANPHNAAAATANARLNGAENVVVCCAAVSDRLGTVTFNLGLNGQVDDGTGGWGRVAVDAVTIDALTAAHGPPAILFVDVEGYECQALRGAAATLERHRPDCFVEVHVGAGLETFGSLGELLAFFPPDAYDLFRLKVEDAAAVPDRTTVGALIGATERFFLIATARG